MNKGRSVDGILHKPIDYGKFEKVMYAVLWPDGSIQHVLHTLGEANVRMQEIAKENDILKKAIKIVRVLVKEL